MTKRPETIDEAAVRELKLWVDNDPESYKLKEAVYGVLDRKRTREIYDSEKAVKAFYNVAEYAAKSYAKTFNDSMTAWSPLPPVEKLQKFCFQNMRKK